MGIGQLDGWKVEKKQAPSGDSAGIFSPWEFLLPGPSQYGNPPVNEPNKKV